MANINQTAIGSNGYRPYFAASWDDEEDGLLYCDVEDRTTDEVAEYARLVKEFKQDAAEAVAQTRAEILAVRAEKAAASKHWSKRALNDMGNGDRLLDHYGDVLRYMSDLKDWAIETDGTWRWDGGALVRALCRQTYDSLPSTEALTYSDDIIINGTTAQPSEREQFLSWWANPKTTASNRALDAMENMASRNQEKFSAQNQFDVYDNMLNCADGVLTLPNNGLYTSFGPPNPNLLFTKRTRARGDPTLDAECPNWDHLMHTQFSYYEQFWVEVLLAYACLRNSNYLKLIIFLLGVQDSGKTQILNALEHAMGTYAGSFEVTMLRGKYSAGPRPDVVRSMLRRVVITTEAGTDANKGMALAADHLKRLSGNDVISARMLFKSTYLERVPCFTCLIGLNSMPVISGADLATKRRTIVIPFSVSTPAEKQITDMTERLRGEADGILARLVQRLAFEEVLSDVPPRFAETTTHAFAQSSDIQEFLDIMTEETGDPNDIVGNDDLLNAYRSYCEQMNIQPSNQLNMRELGMQLSGLGWKSEQEWYQGRKQRIRRGRKLQLVAEGAAAFLRSMNM